MKWAWHLGRPFGIDLYIHATFLLLLLWVGVNAYLATGTLAGAADGIAFIILAFATVALHELGHALTARRFGIATREITLLPIGGVARLERMPERPGQEMLVALAGPAVNAAIAAMLSLWLVATGRSLVVDEAQWFDPATLPARLLWVNVMLAGFNLVPAFPMDGGRVLRALLALHGDYLWATQTAARAGQAIALLLGAVGLLFNPLLAFVALFVWIGAAAEASAAQARAALEGVPVEAAMVTRFEALRADDPLAAAATQLLAGSQVDFPVLDEGELVGILTRAALIDGLAHRGPQARVRDVMVRKFETAHPHELLAGVFARLQQCDCHSAPVVAEGRVVGVVTMENVGELMLIKDALRPRPGPGGAAPAA